LGVAEILGVQVEVVVETAANRCAALEAEEAAGDTARRGVLEAEMPRSAGDRQYLRNDVVVDRGEEGGLLRLTHRVLVEGGGGGMHARVDDGRARRRTDVREATAITACA